MESVNILKEKKNELNYEINYYIEFENNLNKIDEINQKMIRLISNKIKITFEINNNDIENIIQKIGCLNNDDEIINQIYNQVEEEYGISGYIRRRRSKK